MGQVLGLPQGLMVSLVNGMSGVREFSDWLDSQGQPSWKVTFVYWEGRDSGGQSKIKTLRL